MHIRHTFFPFAGIIFLLLTAGITAFRLPDTGLLQTITTRLQKYHDYYQPDKLYLLTDRPYYASGETIWLTVFQVDASGHTPHSRSRVIYVDLLNADQTAVASLKLRVGTTTTAGDITLPAGLPAGTYTLRAYTKWMLNSGATSVFSKPIQVFRADEPAKENLKENLPLADLQFFPEGGNLVSGLESTVGFKAVNQQGKGVDVQGIVTNENGDTVTAFQSYHLGMGAFQLQPQAGHSYQAHVVTADGDTLHYALPVPVADGWVMAVDNSSAEAIKVQMQSSGNNSTQAGIIAHVRGKVYFSATINSSDVITSIPKNNLPEGVVHITAFDELGNARCERLAFVKQSKELQIHVVPGKKVYSPREKVTLAITAQDKNGNPVSANLAIAVTDAGQVATPEYGQTIRSYLLLTSDLKGYVERPEYYFSADNKAGKALDYLLLTQGWRRFTWKEVLQSTLPELRYDMENGLSLAGQLINPSARTPVPNQLITLSVPGGNPAFYQEYTDQQGYFEFMDFSYYQDKDIFLRPMGPTAVQVKIDTSIAISLPVVPPPAFAAEQINNFIRKSSQAEKIKAIYGTEENGEAPLTEDNTPPARTAVADVPADHLIELDKFNQFPSMPETLKEIVPGLIIKDKKGIYSLQVLNIQRKMYFKEEPVYFIDGLLFTENTFFLKLDPAVVQTIEVYGRPDKLARFGNFGQNGVIAAYTRNGDFYPENLPGLLKFPFKGYHQTRELYTPVYATSTADRQQPDFRPLIYWNPSVATDASGKAQVTFSQADNIGNHEIHMEGISAGGMPGAATTSYQVQLPVQSRK